MYVTAQVSYGLYFDKTGRFPVVNVVLGTLLRSVCGSGSWLVGYHPFARIPLISENPPSRSLGHQNAKICEEPGLLRFVLQVLCIQNVLGNKSP